MTLELFEIYINPCFPHYASLCSTEEKKKIIQVWNNLGVKKFNPNVINV